MEILTEALRALIIAGLPVCLLTLAMVWWALHRGHFLETNSIKALKHEIKTMSKSKKDQAENKTHDLIHKKWMKFGGGFYGIVSLITWLVIEVSDIIEMVINFGGFWAFLKSIDLDLIIHIFVEAFTNFIAAIIWPVYWMKRIDTSQVWLWFAAAYAGYLLGIKLAQQIKSKAIIKPESET